MISIPILLCLSFIPFAFGLILVEGDRRPGYKEVLYSRHLFFFSKSLSIIFLYLAALTPWLLFRSFLRYPEVAVIQDASQKGR
jgi:hypothetical protein